MENPYGFPRNRIYTWWILLGFHRFSTSILVYRSSEIPTNGDQQGMGWIVKHDCTPCKIGKLSKHHTQQAHFLRLPKENLSDSPFDVQRISMLLLKQRTKLRVDLSEGTVGSSTLKSPSWSSFAPSKLPFWMGYTSFQDKTRHGTCCPLLGACWIFLTRFFSACCRQ